MLSLLADIAPDDVRKMSVKDFGAAGEFVGDFFKVASS